MPYPAIPRVFARWMIVLVAVSAAGRLAAAGPPAAETRVVSYESFAAVGDGVADDLPAICKAHEHAN